MANPGGSFLTTGAAPMAHSCRLGLVTTGKLEVPGSNPGRAGYVSSWLCICTAPNCLKAWSVQFCPRLPNLVNRGIWGLDYPNTVFQSTQQLIRTPFIVFFKLDQLWLKQPN